jgi:hypothetical protein
LAAEGFKVTGYRLELVGFFEGDGVGAEGDRSRSEAAGSERANEA